MTTGTVIRTTNSGRMALTCSCGVTEKVRPRFAARRKVFCGNCHSVLRRPDGKSEAPASEAPAKPRGARVRPTRSRRPIPREERAARFHRMPSFERHVAAIGVWYRIGGMLGILASLALVALGGPSGLLGILVSGAILVLGHGLTRYNQICRWLVVALAGFALLSSTYGLVAGGKGILSVLTSFGWNGAVMAILLSSGAQRVFTPEFRDIVARSPEVRVPWWSSPFFFVPAAFLLLALLGVAVTLLTVL